MKAIKKSLESSVANEKSLESLMSLIKATVGVDTSALDEAVHKLRISTFNLQIACCRNEKGFSDTLVQIKSERGELPDDFILLAKEKVPQYAELLKTFIIFG